MTLIHALFPSSQPIGSRIKNILSNPSALFNDDYSNPDYNPPTEYYKTMLAFHLRGDKAITPGKVFFLGDSLTQGLPVSSVIKDAVNYGVGTDDTTGLANRINQYESVKSAKALVIAIGVNDLLIRSNDEISDNYIELLDALPPGPLIFCSLMLPIQESVRSEWYGRSSKRIRELNKRFAAICENRGHVVIDATTALSDQQGELIADYHEGDGLHLASNGYKVWMAVIKEALDAASNAN